MTENEVNRVLVVGNYDYTRSINTSSFMQACLEPWSFPCSPPPSFLIFMIQGSPSQFILRHVLQALDHFFSANSLLSTLLF